MIFINARFLSQNITGVQRYAIEISRQLKKSGSAVRFLAPKNIIHLDLAEEFNAEILGTLTGHLWEQIELPRYLKKHGNPLLLNLCNTAPLLYENKVVTLHDIAFERYPQTFSWRFRYAYQFAMPRIAKTSKKLLTDSNFSKNEISDVYGVDNNKIEIVHCAVSANFQPVAPEERLEKYILAVSSINYQKNFRALIQAFNLLNNKSIKLYLVGALNKNFADHKLVEDIERNPNIQFMGRVDDDELVRLYSNAQCFVYPSLYEGFGIPPLEAQACGCPCIVSNAASLPEVCDDSVVYCDPYDIEDMARQLEFVLSDQVLRDALIQKGFKNVKRFSWEKSAKQILKIIKENT
ncbi:glycosyltransferase family 1 protein [Thiomicrorhabdus sp. Kp2]|uniref:glycosyltransferase family 4 protein n=1 Tax=Thiomicrorhabdus sp. Kp2 TaxID=1123518 RepID=UPI0003FF925C|nr:glycosyltransferase family 1 protein [Thiomicrorhabdus sp. Kp2]